MDGGGGSTSNPSSAPRSAYHRKFKIMKFFWRAAVVSNVALGVYLFVMPKKKQFNRDSSKAVEVVTPPPVETDTPLYDGDPFAPPPAVPVKVREPIPEDQQRELLKWMLEEKRKVKSQNREEKQRINEEKAILKQFIRKESIPSI